MPHKWLLCARRDAVSASCLSPYVCIMTTHGHVLVQGIATRVMSAERKAARWGGNRFSTTFSHIIFPLLLPPSSHLFSLCPSSRAFCRFEKWTRVPTERILIFCRTLLKFPLRSFPLLKTLWMFVCTLKSFSCVLCLYYILLIILSSFLSYLLRSFILFFPLSFSTSISFCLWRGSVLRFPLCPCS